jgi:putative ABC transport system permease protein
MAGSAYMLIYVAVALLGAFIIGNIMMMVVLERRREIGILKAMGLTRLETLWLFLLEGAALGLIGSLVGGLVGTAVSLYFHFNGLDFTKALSSVSIPIDNVVHFTVSAGGITQALLIGTIVSALVALPASWQAARMTAVGAIKSV